MTDPFDPDGDALSVVEPESDIRLGRPRRYQVLLHNDDYTTREFVVEILMGVFHRTESDAIAIMLHVHHNGIGVAGVYTREVAETKVTTVEARAKEQEFPLRVTMEPEESSDGGDDS